MEIQQLVILVLQVSLGVLVFCVALQTQRGDFMSLLRQPGLLARSLLSMFVIMPIVTVLMSLGFSLLHGVEVALVALALSPVPPILPGKQIKAGGTGSYAVALLAISAVVAIVFIPVALALLGLIFPATVSIPASRVATVVGMSVLLPLAAGIVVRSAAPQLSTRIAKPLSGVSALLLAVAFIPIMVKVWPAMMALLGHFTLVAIVVFVAVSLVVGHLLGGPAPGDRTVLGLATASRHPGVAVALASANANGDHAPVAAVLLAFLLSVILTIPYVRWRTRLARGVH